jgi:hypothetical protein
MTSGNGDTNKNNAGLDKAQILDQLAVTLQDGDKKQAFLDDLQYAVRYYIEEQGSDVLTIVERDDNGDIHQVWRLAASGDYIERLLAFLRNDDYRGRKLDSTLTDPIIEVVVKKFARFYEANGAHIARTLLQDRRFTEKLVENVVDQHTELNARLRRRAIQVITDELQAQLRSRSGELVSATASATATKQIAVILDEQLAYQIQGLVLKVVALPVINQMLLFVIRKFIVSTILYSVIRFFAVKLGVGIGGATMIFLLPIIALWIARDIANFPTELGRQVGEQVREQLNEHYDEINRYVMSEVYDEFTRVSIEQLTEGLANDEDLKTFIDVLVDEEDEDIDLE